MKATAKIILLILMLVLLCACGKEKLSDPVNGSNPTESQNRPERIPLENNGEIDELEEEEESKELPLPIFPNPDSTLVGLSGQDAVLFDAAVNALHREPNEDICIPVIGLYGSYETENGSVLLCSVQYHYFYGYDGNGCSSDEGGQHRAAKAVLQEDDNGKIICTSFELNPNGGIVNWIDDFCGPLTELKKHFLEDQSWDIVTTMPTANELLSRYVENLGVSTK